MIQIFREETDHSSIYGPRIVREHTCLDELIDLHCSCSYRHTVDLLVEFMRYAIKQNPTAYLPIIEAIAREHDFKVEVSSD